MPNVVTQEENTSAPRRIARGISTFGENQITQISGTKRGGFAKYFGEKTSSEFICVISFKNLLAPLDKIFYLTG